MTHTWCRVWVGVVFLCAFADAALPLEKMQDLFISRKYLLSGSVRGRAEEMARLVNGPEHYAQDWTWDQQVDFVTKWMKDDSLGKVVSKFEHFLPSFPTKLTEANALDIVHRMYDVGLRLPHRSPFFAYMATFMTEKARHTLYNASRSLKKTQYLPHLQRNESSSALHFYDSMEEPKTTHFPLTVGKVKGRLGKPYKVHSVFTPNNGKDVMYSFFKTQVTSHTKKENQSHPFVEHSSRKYAHDDERAYWVVTDHSSTYETMSDEKFQELQEIEHRRYFFEKEQEAATWRGFMFEGLPASITEQKALQALGRTRGEAHVLARQNAQRLNETIVGFQEQKDFVPLPTGGGYIPLPGAMDSTTFSNLVFCTDEDAHDPRRLQCWCRDIQRNYMEEANPFTKQAWKDMCAPIFCPLIMSTDNIELYPRTSAEIRDYVDEVCTQFETASEQSNIYTEDSFLDDGTGSRFGTTGGRAGRRWFEEHNTPFKDSAFLRDFNLLPENSFLNLMRVFDRDNALIRRGNEHGHLFTMIQPMKMTLDNRILAFLAHVYSRNYANVSANANEANTQRQQGYRVRRASRLRSDAYVFPHVLAQTVAADSFSRLECEDIDPNVLDKIQDWSFRRDPVFFRKAVNMILRFFECVGRSLGTTGIAKALECVENQFSGFPHEGSMGTILDTKRLTDHFKTIKRAMAHLRPEPLPTRIVCSSKMDCCKFDPSSECCGAVAEGTTREAAVCSPTFYPCICELGRGMFMPNDYQWSLALAEIQMRVYVLIEEELTALAAHVTQVVTEMATRVQRMHPCAADLPGSDFAEEENVNTRPEVDEEMLPPNMELSQQPSLGLPGLQKHMCEYWLWKMKFKTRLVLEYSHANLTILRHIKVDETDAPLMVGGAYTRNLRRFVPTGADTTGETYWQWGVGNTKFLEHNKMRENDALPRMGMTVDWLKLPLDQEGFDRLSQQNIPGYEGRYGGIMWSGPLNDYERNNMNPGIHVPEELFSKYMYRMSYPLVLFPFMYEGDVMSTDGKLFWEVNMESTKGTLPFPKSNVDHCWRRRRDCPSLFRPYFNRLLINNYETKTVCRRDKDFSCEPIDHEIYAIVRSSSYYRDRLWYYYIFQVAPCSLNRGVNNGACYSGCREDKDGSLRSCGSSGTTFNTRAMTRRARDECGMSTDRSDNHPHRDRVEFCILASSDCAGGRSIRYNSVTSNIRAFHDDDDDWVHRGYIRDFPPVQSDIDQNGNSGTVSRSVYARGYTGFALFGSSDLTNRVSLRLGTFDTSDKKVENWVTDNRYFPTTVPGEFSPIAKWFHYAYRNNKKRGVHTFETDAGRLTISDYKCDYNSPSDRYFRARYRETFDRHFPRKHWGTRYPDKSQFLRIQKGMNEMADQTYWAKHFNDTNCRPPSSAECSSTQPCFPGMYCDFIRGRCVATYDSDAQGQTGRFPFGSVPKTHLPVPRILTDEIKQRIIDSGQDGHNWIPEIFMSKDAYGIGGVNAFKSQEWKLTDVRVMEDSSWFDSVPEYFMAQPMSHTPSYNQYQSYRHNVAPEPGNVVELQSDLWFGWKLDELIGGKQSNLIFSNLLVQLNDDTAPNDLFWDDKTWIEFSFMNLELRYKLASFDDYFANRNMPDVTEGGNSNDDSGEVNDPNDLQLTEHLQPIRVSDAYVPIPCLKPSQTTYMYGWLDLTSLDQSDQESFQSENYNECIEEDSSYIFAPDISRLSNDLQGQIWQDHRCVGNLSGYQGRYDLYMGENTLLQMVLNGWSALPRFELEYPLHKVDNPVGTASPILEQMGLNSSQFFDMNEETMVGENLIENQCDENEDRYPASGPSPIPWPEWRYTVDPLCLEYLDYNGDGGQLHRKTLWSNTMASPLFPFLFEHDSHNCQLSSDKIRWIDPSCFLEGSWEKDTLELWGHNPNDFKYQTTQDMAVWRVGYTSSDSEWVDKSTFNETNGKSLPPRLLFGAEFQYLDETIYERIIVHDPYCETSEATLIYHDGVPVACRLYGSVYEVHTPLQCLDPSFELIDGKCQRDCATFENNGTFHCYEGVEPECSMDLEQEKCVRKDGNLQPGSLEYECVDGPEYSMVWEDGMTRPFTCQKDEQVQGSTTTTEEIPVYEKKHGIGCRWAQCFVNENEDPTECTLMSIDWLPTDESEADAIFTYFPTGPAGRQERTGDCLMDLAGQVVETQTVTKWDRALIQTEVDKHLVSNMGLKLLPSNQVPMNKVSFNDACHDFVQDEINRDDTEKDTQNIQWKDFVHQDAATAYCKAETLIDFLELDVEHSPFIPEDFKYVSRAGFPTHCYNLDLSPPWSEIECQYSAMGVSDAQGEYTDMSQCFE